MPKTAIVRSREKHNKGRNAYKPPFPQRFAYQNPPQWGTPLCNTRYNSSNAPK
jgi:hypothetical protein